ncbi:MAG: LysE family transporter [Pseudomonadota bacterium]
MGAEHILAFNLALLAALVSPGPALLIAIRTTLVEGRLAGVATGCGLGLMAAIWTLTALLGLESLFRLVPWAYAAVKTAGALYLLWIAWKTWTGARDPLPEAGSVGRRAFRGGVLANLANPKSVLFSAAVLVVIFPRGLGVAETAVVVVNHFVVEVLFYGGLAVLLGSEAVSRRYLAAKATLDRITATVLGALGLRLLVER